MLLIYIQYYLFVESSGKNKLLQQLHEAKAFAALSKLRTWRFAARASRFRHQAGMIAGLP